MKKIRTIAGQRLHTTYQGKLLARPQSTYNIKPLPTIGPATFASGTSNRASSASCGNTTAQRLGCQICLSGATGQPKQPPQTT